MKRNWTVVLNLLQTIAIVAGLAFGAMELNQFRSEQRRQSRLELARSFMTPEFNEAFAIVLGMPDTLTGEEIEAQYAEHIPKLLLLSQTFETIGILVFQGDLELAMVDDFFGTGIITSWRKFERWTREFREQRSAPSVNEWFQWLAERLERYRSTRQPAPAYDAHRDWRPQ